MDIEFWLFITPMIGGQILWLIASQVAQSWLVKNVEDYEPPSVGAVFLIGRLFTAFGPIHRYKKEKEQRGETPSMFFLFYAGLVVSFGGLAVFIFWIMNEL